MGKRRVVSGGGEPQANPTRPCEKGNRELGKIEKEARMRKNRVSRKKHSYKGGGEK